MTDFKSLNGFDVKDAEARNKLQSMFNFTHNFNLTKNDMIVTLTYEDDTSEVISARNDANLHIVLNNDKTIGKIYGNIMVVFPATVGVNPAKHIRIECSGVDLDLTNNMNITGAGLRILFVEGDVVNDTTELSYALHTNDKLIIDTPVSSITTMIHYIFLANVLFIEDFGD